MGLRCLLGHDFDEPELRREREENGEEVVITVSEEKTCSRCGYTKTVSENKEVTSIEQLAQTAGDSEPSATGTTTTAEQTDTTAATGETATAGGDAAPTTADDTPAPATAETGVTAAAETPTPEPTPSANPSAAGTHTTADANTAADDGAELLDTDSESGHPQAEPEPTTGDTAEEPTAPSTTTDESDDANDEDVQTADNDDGIILSTSNGESGEASATETTDREPGEWPDHDTDVSSPTGEWPEQSGDDEGYDAETPPDQQPDTVSFGSGFTPEVEPKTVGGESADTEDVIEEPADEEFTKAGETSLYEPTVDDINTEFYCPECGFSRHAGASSMRAGDICPECRRGYIAEREL